MAVPSAVGPAPKRRRRVGWRAEFRSVNPSVVVAAQPKFSAYPLDDGPAQRRDGDRTGRFGPCPQQARPSGRLEPQHARIWRGSDHGRLARVFFAGTPCRAIQSSVLVGAGHAGYIQHHAPAAHPGGMEPRGPRNSGARVECGRLVRAQPGPTVVAGRTLVVPGSAQPIECRVGPAAKGRRSFVRALSKKRVHGAGKGDAAVDHALGRSGGGASANGAPLDSALAATDALSRGEFP